MIESIKSWKARHWIASTCGFFIILRAIFPDLRIDEVSLGLLVIAALVLIVPDIGDMISRLKKVKKGDLELEFEGRIENLKRKTDEVEAIIDTYNLQFGEIPDDVQDRINRSLVEPRAALIAIAMEIENRLRHLSKINNILLKGRYFSPRRAIDSLVEARQLDPNVKGLFEDFWTIRNEVVHSHAVTPDGDYLFSLVDLGVRILRFLYSEPTGNDE